MDAFSVTVVSLDALEVSATPREEHYTDLGILRCWSCRRSDGVRGVLLTVPQEGRPGFRHEDVAGMLIEDEDSPELVSESTAELVVMGFLHGIAAERMRSESVSV